MKVAILAGGAGTRLSEETQVRPKPMVEIGGRPILWHIMQRYADFGFDEFVIALGYKGDCIRRFFVEECSADGHLRVDLGRSRVSKHDSGQPNWKLDLVDTGPETATGGRIKRLEPFLGGEPFMLTWGDGLADIDLHALLEFHRAHQRLATVTAVRPPERFGRMEIADGVVESFEEKPAHSNTWINGAFFVLEPQVLDYIAGDETHWEHEPMQQLAAEQQLMAYRHESFWQCMDTLKEKQFLESLWNSGHPPWQRRSTSDEGHGHGTSGLYRDDPGTDAARRAA